VVRETAFNPSNLQTDRVMTMSKYRDLAQQFRWWLLAITVTCLVIGLWWMYWPPASEETVGWPMAFFILIGWIPEGAKLAGPTFVIIGILLLLQWMFLSPGRRWRIRMAEQARPMHIAMVTAAGMAMLLSVGLFVTLSEIHFPEAWFDLQRTRQKSGAPWHFYGIIAALWLFWTVVFWNYRRSGDGLSRVGRLATGLVAGSLLEILVATSVYAWNPHQTDCYCARGSYAGLVFGGTVLVWAFGPALLPLFLRQKQLRDRALQGSIRKE